ncbi:MAG: hypothetical protein ABJA57_12090 [Ginsengibacter sp.]
MKTINLLSLVIFTLASGSQLHAQTDTSQKVSYIKIGTSYLSNAVYSGRKDSSIVSYFRPAIGYFHKSGLSINVEASLLVNAPGAGRLDEVAIEAGYNYSIRKLDAGC